ncbi:MAG TPA: IS200/IS605 family transposase [Pyrinomonadaceae bacterium]|jgi:putative transposase
MIFRRTAHAPYDTSYHLVWSPKYRKHILTGALAERVEQMFREIADSYDGTRDEMEVSPDHVHLFCSFPRVTR